ncbi:DUF1302 domain-containing protein [Amphritea sp. HPY]|uniref:DUF1302 domain-containing protein n=1 Tax=Amphritea sp. HPY TaxID=3421652 RepID=UPI003D7C7CA0
MLSRVSRGYQIPVSAKSVLAIAIAVSLPLLPSTAHATSFELKNGLNVEWDSSISYGTMWRLEDQSAKLLTDPVRDDGDRNFDQGLVSNRISFITEADISGENSGVFARASGFYDDEVKDKNLSDGADELHGSNIKLLDAFYYTSQDWGSVRVGNQVVSWGESFFLPGLSALQSPIDLTKFNVPGVELKEIFLPEEQIYGQFNLTEELTLEAYYQWDWNKHDFDGVGSYFSSFDYFGPGTQDFPADYFGPGAPVVPFTGYQDASASGQYGAALRYIATNLNDTEFGLYFLNFHDRVGIQVFDADGFHYEYKEDNKAFGASVSTTLGNTNVSGEVFYRPDAPVYPVDFASVGEADIWQAQVSWIHNFGPSAIADDMDFVGEVAYQYVDDAEFGTELGYGSQEATAVAAELDLYYKNVLPSVNLIIPIGFVANVDGTAADQMVTYDEKTYSWYTGVTGTYGDNWNFSAKYTNFFGDGNDELTGSHKQGPTASLGDRDFISLNVSYSF